MLTEREFGEQQQQLGRRLHRNDGVWWESVQLLYCKAAFEFGAFKAGAARPRRSKSLLGYSHQVPEPSDGNRTITYLVLEGDSLRNFGLEILGSKKRNQVRKGLRSCRVDRIEGIEPYLEQMRQINISQAQRQGRVDVPPEYYIQEADAWRKELRAYFAHTGTEWWAAFSDERVIAYLVTLRVGDTLMIQAVKSHSDWLSLCPTDALYFLVLQAASQDPSCRQVINGGPATPSLDRFKEQFLFRPKTFGYYTPNAFLHELMKGTVLRLRSIGLGLKAVLRNPRRRERRQPLE